MTDIPEHIKTYAVLALALALIGTGSAAVITWTIQSPAETRGLLLLPAVLIAIFAQQFLPPWFRRACRERAEYRRQQSKTNAPQIPTEQKP